MSETPDGKLTSSPLTKGGCLWVMKSLKGLFSSPLQSNAVERGFLLWLKQSEQRAILPFKWGMLVTAACFWIVSRSNPQTMVNCYWVNTLFLFYFVCTLLESYWFRFRTIKQQHIRIISILSYVADAFFVVGINIFAIMYSDYSEYGSSPLFLLLFFILIMRGMTVFRTAKGSLFVNSFVGVLAAVFVIASRLHMSGSLTPVDIASLLFIALVTAGTWFISRIILEQKEELMRTREKMVRSDYLASVGQLASGMAHEINNPIGIISAYAEFLMRNSNDDPKRDDYEKIFREAQRCKELVDDLLQQVRVRPMLLEKVDITDILKGCLAMALKTAEKDNNKIEISFRSDEEPFFIIADKSHLTRVFLNITLNAVDALTGKAGLITIDVRHVDDFADIKIIDNGPGIPEKLETKVLEPFFTTKEKGTGLGLWIANETIRNHNGTLSLRKADKKLGGTVVEIILPVKQPE